MKRSLVVWLVSCLALPLPSAASGTQAQPAQAVANTRTFKLSGTLVSVDLAAKRLTFVDGATDAMDSAILGAEALDQAAKLKSGQRVTLHCRVVPPSTTPVVESIKKKSHKKLWILGLAAVASVGFIAMASEPPI